MIENIKKNIKNIVIVLIILLIASCVYGGIIHQIVLARSGEEVTELSKKRTTEDKEWQERQKKDESWKANPDYKNNEERNRNVVRDPRNPFDESNPKLRDLFQKIKPDQIRDGGVYIAASDLREIPSLFCSALGVALPDWGNTYVVTYDHVLGSYVSTNITEQGPYIPAQVTPKGKLTAYLLPEDLVGVPDSAKLMTSLNGVLDGQVWGLEEDENGELQEVLISGQLVTDVSDGLRSTSSGASATTVFMTEWTEWGADPIKRFDDPAYSKTLAKFTDIEEKEATPAESWVLSEFDKNVTPDVTFKETDREYSGIPDGLCADVEGKVIIMVGDPGEEQFVEYRDNKYYYVEVEIDDEVEGIECFPYSYVQHAWWKVKTVGNDKQSNMIETDLAREAEDYEAYIKEVTGQDDVTQLEKDENGLFKIDYQVDFEPQDSSEIKKMFNAETNKYIIGPFKLDYLRRATKQGKREKVSFCGISDSLIIATDADGNELLDEDGNSRLVLDENYRFVYDDPEAHKKNRNEWDREKDDEDCTDELYYPYPAPNEEFYIEIDYLDDMSKIKNIKFNFQYMTSGGKYEYCEGSYLTIRWKFNYDIDMERRPGAKSDGDETASVRTNVDMNLTRDITVSESNVDGIIDIVGAKFEGPQPYTPPTSGPSGPSGPITHTPGPFTPGAPYDPNDERHWFRFKYWLEPASYTTNNAQSLSHAFDDQFLIDIDEVELELIPEDEDIIDLRTSIGGFVWIDKDEQKDESSSGTLGIYEDGIDERAPKNSVEVIVWKVEYDASGEEVGREKALGWMDDEEGEGQEENNKSNAENSNNGDGEGEEDSATKIDFKENRLYIDDNGEYLIPKIQVPSKEGKEEGTIFAYDVEFIYDGQTYETTEYLKSTGVDDVEGKLEEFKKTPEETAGEAKDYEKYANDSYVVENADERKEFDSYFTEVKGKDPISGGETTGETAGGPTGFYYEDEDGEDPKAGDGGDEYLKYKKTDNPDEVEQESFKDTINKVNGGAHPKTISTLVTHNEDGFILKKYRFASRISEAGLILPYEKQFHVEKEMYDNLYFQEQPYKPVDEYFHQINMGLLERYHSDASMLKDLYSAKMVVNNQESPTITFNSLAALTEEALHHQIQAGYREQTYKIDLYDSDYRYRSSVYNTVTDEITKTVLEKVKEDTELRMFVTYKLSIKNESIKTDMTINEFKDYYDKTFTLIDKDLEVNVEATDAEQGTSGPVFPKKTVAYAPYYRKLSAGASGAELYKWNKEEDLKASGIDDGVVGDIKFEKTDGKGDYQGSVSTSLRGVNGESADEKLTLEPGETFEIFVTYEVDRDGFEKAGSESANANNERPDLLNKKNNIAEITNYTTIYTEEGVARHNTTRYEAGQISGRIDQDSAPDNLNMIDVDSVEDWEDDTEAAPTLDIQVKQPEDRSLDGVVWEDSKIVTENSADGNGIFDSGEPGIGGVDVTLVEKIRVTAADLAGPDGTVADLNRLDYEFEFIWPDGIFNGLKSWIQTGSDGGYSFQNFVAGDYVVRFEYGNNDATLKYNGQDYKMTAYQTGMVNANPGSYGLGDTVIGSSDMEQRAGMATLNNEWQDLSRNDNAKKLESTRVSDARDYEPRRMKVMAYSRTVTNENAEVLASYVNDQADPKMTEDYKAILRKNIDNLKANTAMVANTAKFKVDIEKQDTITYKEIDNGEILKTTEGHGNQDKSKVKHEYIIANVDFGLVERPETKMFIKKELARIDLFKNDGSGMVLSVECDEDGNIIKTNGDDGLAGSVNINKISEIEKKNLAVGIQGFKYVAIESSYLAGLDVNLAYRITVVNGSETDYIGEVLSEIKNVQQLYDKVVDYETREGKNNLVPFNTGNDIIYGKYVGLHYYTNEISGSADNTSKYGYNYVNDVVVTTTVDQIADYIDNDISLNLDETQGVVDQSWNMSTDIDRLHKLSTVSYKENTRGDNDSNLVDNKGRRYIGNESRNNIAMSENELVGLVPEITYVKTKTVKENGVLVPVTKSEGGVLVPQVEIVPLTNVYSANEGVSSNKISMYNPNLTKELKPGEKAQIMIATSAHANSEDSKAMNYDNLAEIVMYSNTAGRRDMQAIPGNANMIAKENPAWQAGYTLDYQAKANDNATESGDLRAFVNKYFVPNKDIEVADNGAKAVVETERDAFAARDTVTFSEPTGLSMSRQMIDNTVKLILISLLAAAVVVVTIIILIALKKKKYDDKNIINVYNK